MKLGLLGSHEYSTTTALVRHERVQQRTSEHIEAGSSWPMSKTVEAVTLVAHERVQQRTAAKPVGEARPPGIVKVQCRDRRPVPQ